MSYKDSLRMRLGNWLAGSKFAFVRKLSNLCYTHAENQMLEDTAKEIVSIQMKQDKQLEEIFQAYPEVKPLLHTFKLPSGTEKYDMFTLEGVINFVSISGAEKLAPFLREFASTKVEYDLIMQYYARLLWWLTEKGYYNIATGKWTQNMDEETEAAALQLFVNELTELICKQSPQHGDFNKVNARLKELL